MKQISYIVLLVLILTSCSTSRNTLRNTTIGGLSGTEYMEKVIEWTPSRDNLTARARIELNVGSSSPMSVNANMRVRRGEIIRFSVAPILGIEVARIDITPDKIMAIDRMNKRYVELGFAEISSLLNTYSLHCRYADFIMLGNDVFPQSIEMISEGTDKKYSLDMKLSRVNTDSNWDSKTELSSKYRKMSVQELLKLFIKQ